MMEFFGGKRERSVLNRGVRILNGIAQYSSRVQIALLSFGFGLVETHLRSGGDYLEEFEPAQILITIDGS